MNTKLVDVSRKLVVAIVVTLALGLQAQADEGDKASSWAGRAASGTTWDESLPQAQERRVNKTALLAPAPEDKAVRAGAVESIFTMIIRDLKFVDVVGGYAVLIKNKDFKDSDHGPFVGIQGALPFEKTFSSGNYIGTCLVLGMITLPDVNRTVAGFGLHGELVTIPFAGPAKDSTPILRLTPGNFSAPLSWTLALICPVDELGIGVEASLTVRTF